MGAMAALGSMSVDMYLPSLPTVAADLGTSPAAAQFTISGVLIGAALGQLLMGPLSDRFGRRGPALVGISLHIVASLLCMVVPSIGALIVLRMLQGVGNSAASITAMAVIRDRLTGGPAARVLSRLILVIGVAPLLAPTVGGLIAGVAGWRAVFGVLAALGVALLVVVWRFLPETHPVQRRSTGGLPDALRGYRSLLTDRHFLALAVLPGLAMGSVMSYVAGAPFVLQVGFGLTATQFALIFALNGAGGIIASQVNAALVNRVAPMSVLRVMLPVTAIAAGVVLAVAVTGAGGLVGLLVALWVLMAIVIFVPPNATALALSRRGERAGTAAALIGSLQAGIAGLVSPVVGLLGGDAPAMATVMVGSLTTALIVALVGTPAYRRRRAGVATGSGDASSDVTPGEEDAATPSVPPHASGRADRHPHAGAGPVGSRATSLAGSSAGATRPPSRTARSGPSRGPRTPSLSLRLLSGRAGR
jgi:DHA1 family bicyclomycin/chloramphenicol resistance-like MFS transporter